MHRLLFQNRFNALGFVVLVLLGVMILVDSGDSDSNALERAAESFGSDQQAEEVRPEAQPAPRPRAVPEPEPEMFADEEDLVDDTSGTDSDGWSAGPEFDGGLEEAPPDNAAGDIPE